MDNPEIQTHKKTTTKKQNKNKNKNKKQQTHRAYKAKECQKTQTF
jgi:hypothetical protein